MADIPILPTEENKETLQEFINLQRQLESILIKQGKVYEDIGHINKDLQVQAEKRLSLARENTEANKKDLATLQMEYKRMHAARTDTDKNAARAVIESLKQVMSIRQDEMKLAMELNSLEMDIAKRKYEESTKWSTFASKAGKDLFGINVKSFDIAKQYGDQLQKYPFGLQKSAYYWGAILMMMKGAFDLFNQFDKAAWNFRKTMGMTRGEAALIRKNAEAIALEFMGVGVTIDSAYKATLALREQMGSAYVISKELVKDVSVMAAQLGVSEENSAAFLRNLASVSGTSMETQSNMMYTAAYMAQAAGVPLDKIMGDISNRSTQTLTMMSRMPNQVLRTAIEARRLNTSINEMAKGSRSLLDFNESVNAEMDASVLLGRSINLQRARELAYRRDIEGSTKEILRITKSIDFENLDVFQQEAFARATGRSVDELLRMVQAEREWNKARRSKDPEVRAMVQKYEQMRKANEKVVISETEKLKIMVQQKSNQDRMAAISQKWNALMAQAQSFLLPIVDAILSVIPPLIQFVPMTMAMLGNISKLFTMTGAWLAGTTKVMDVFSLIGLKVFNFGGVFAKIGTFIVNIGSKIAGVFGKVGGMLGGFGKFLGVFGKFLGPIGWIITAFQFITSLFKHLHGIGDAFKKGILHGILHGLKAIGLALYDTLLKPFVDAWNWIKGIFVGKSPSTLALGILKGITSIGATLFDAITAPWRKALAWITSKIPGMGKISEKIGGGLKGMLGGSVEKNATATYVPAVTVTPNGTTVAGQTPPPQQSAAASSSQASNDKLLTEILESINKLNSNLEAGKIGFYVDGQLLSATIARQSEFRGGYGVNKV